MLINGQTPTKQCRVCKEHLPMYEFYKSKNMCDGFMNRCIKCMKELKRPNELDTIRKNENSEPGFR